MENERHTECHFADALCWVMFILLGFLFLFIAKQEILNVFWFEKQKRRMWHRLNDNKSLICYQILKEHFKEISNERGWKEIFSKLVFDFCCTKRDFDHATEANYGQRCVFQHRIVKWEFQRLFLLQHIKRHYEFQLIESRSKRNEMFAFVVTIHSVTDHMNSAFLLFYDCAVRWSQEWSWYYLNSDRILWKIWFIWEEKKNNTRRESNWKDKKHSVHFAYWIDETKSPLSQDL